MSTRPGNDRQQRILWPGLLAVPAHGTLCGMPLPPQDTLVTYPNGSLTEQASVLFVGVEDDRTLLLTDVTPFHPVDPRWPDQGPDQGTVTAGDVTVPVVDCVIGATDGSELFVGDAVPVRRGEPGRAFVVVHVLDTGAVTLKEGQQVTLAVDGAHRAALSAGHTACHVAALALNAALAARWRKPVATDGLGHPDFDQLAITSSQIRPDGAVDRYRLGKSLRKKGFDSDGLVNAVGPLSEAANTQLAEWVATGAPIVLEISGPGLTDLREWVCALPEGTQRIPCGGTHLTSLAEVDAITVELTFDETAGELMMTTSVPRPEER
jgi:alanyl-tRNA synthetase